MRQVLRLHPDSRCGAVTDIEVEVARPRSGPLVLHYFVTGKVNDLRLPPAAAPARRDGLWRHTCFEAFVRASPSGVYYELNFSPSMRWAAYRFSDYRSGMSVAGEIGEPRIEARSNAEGYELQASLALECLSSEAVWHLGLSAVIEDAGGQKSYWALAHPAGKADFHHADCFVLELPVAERP